MVPDYLDRYSRGNTWCHRLSPEFKLACGGAVIGAGLLVPVAHWPVHGCLLSLCFAAQSAAGLPVRYVAQRLAAFLPLLALMALSVPAGGGRWEHWELAGGIVVRGTLSLMAGLWVVNTTPFPRLLWSLRRWCLPASMAAILAFMYRYVFVVFDELDRMQAARRARTLGRASWRYRWHVSGQLVGMLLIRSLDRAERVHGAMCARGWDGQVRTLDTAPAEGGSDVR